MKSYTNKSGESIEVTKDHLDTAVKIKLELQKASPSRKCNWRMHKKMMEREGYLDSDSGENYRQMIKQYQKSLGELPKVEKYADMVADSKLESIKELVGEIAYEKRENQHVLKELNKVKRDVIDFTLIAEQVGQAFREYDWSKLDFTSDNRVKIKEINKHMIVCLSDLHIGAVVNSDINTYNYEVAKERMQKYLDRIINEIKNNDITKVFVMNLGDSIEHPYMHNLSYSCEFTMSEQIVKATDLIIKFVKELSKHVPVVVSGIGGNHDRLDEDKNKSLNGDHAVKIINEGIKNFIENSEIEKVAFMEAKDYEHSIIVNGTHIKFVHGDLDSKDDKSLIAKHCSNDGLNYKLIVMGHYHHHFITEQGLGKAVVGFGSLKGADGYSEKIRRLSDPSQGFIIVDENGEYEIRSVKL